jgi:SprT protein
MRLFKQLEFAFPGCSRPALSGRSGPDWRLHGDGALRLQRDLDLEKRAAGLLRAAGATRIACVVRVEWNPRLQTAAGRADRRKKLISLNPRLQEYGIEEVERTFRHELAHLLAQFRVKSRRRILPHGPEWREACRDLGIADEARCQNLSFAVKKYRVRFVYRCPNCRKSFPRVRRVRRTVACLACCRKHNGDEFDPRFRLKLVTTP